MSKRWQSVYMETLHSWILRFAYEYAVNVKYCLQVCISVSVNARIHNSSSPGLENLFGESCSLHCVAIAHDTITVLGHSGIGCFSFGASPLLILMVTHKAVATKPGLSLFLKL